MAILDPTQTSTPVLLRRLTLLLGAVLLAAVLAVAVFNTKPLEPAELARRCREYPVTWPDYQENIKAIDARSVAQWQGSLTAIDLDGDLLLVSFRLAAPWSDWQAFLPILIRTPEGKVFRNSEARHEDGICRYVFDLGGQARALPWIEVHYPHVERQIYLDAAGSWRALPHTN